MLKIFAIITMFIDHFAIAFLDPFSTSYLVLRAIGRVSMPIFAYMLASGYIHTKNYNKYLIRMLTMAIIAQIPFTMLISGISFIQLFTTDLWVYLFYTLNIGFTFCVALIFLKIMDFTRVQKSSLLHQFAQALLGMIILYYAHSCDYGAYGICVVFIFYVWILIFNQSKKSLLICGAIIGVLSIVFYGFPGANQWLSALAIIPIYYLPHTKSNYKWVFYVFYPAHLILLVVISAMLH
ncbi:TraX family protein [Candidatus Epulonipiscium viviparus]|uniref:TraX family protein n=1 Tax=Candidatus Epulonipiscium viviparus TaxID=420336 RepID=UPI00016BFC92|nr:TraX family protein [Candidatus Epulopiscium viviparus]